MNNRYLALVVKNEDMFSPLNVVCSSDQLKYKVAGESNLKYTDSFPPVQWGQPAVREDSVGIKFWNKFDQDQAGSVGQFKILNCGILQLVFYSRFESWRSCYLAYPQLRTTLKSQL